jgi:site-specific recombinase XerD
MTMKQNALIFDAVESFFTDYLKLTRGCSLATLASYRDTLRLLFDYVSVRQKTTIDRLRVLDFDVDIVLAFLEQLQSERHNRVSTRNCRLAALRSFFAHVLRRHPEHAGRVARILALRPKRHSPAPPRYLEPPAVQALLRGPDRDTPAGRRDYALILFLYNTGARVSEAIGVRRKDLLPGPAVLLHGKGNKTRVSPLWSETLAAIKAQSAASASPDTEEPVFQNARRNALSRHGVYHILMHHAASVHKRDSAVPAKINPHLLRHSCASAMLQAGADLATIRDQLGHVSVATTSRYATSNLKLKRTALEAFWAVTGMSAPKHSRWRPTPKLSKFLHSI